MDTNNSITENFNKLSQGLMQPSYQIAFEAHKNLYEIGRPVVPILKEKILDIKWSNPKYKELSGYISGVYSLLHDLDEDEANSVADTVISNGCPEYIHAILKSINRFSVKNYKNYRIKSVEIYELKSINAKCDIGFYLNKWLESVPESDLKNITRLYVTTRDEINASGTYTPILNSIALLWDNYYKDKTFLFNFFALITERILYHEIGHHKHCHDFGTDSDQEKEADKYAFGIVKKNHKFIYKVLKLFPKFGMKSQRDYHRWGL